MNFSLWEHDRAGRIPLVYGTAPVSPEVLRGRTGCDAVCHKHN